MSTPDRTGPLRALYGPRNCPDSIRPMDVLINVFVALHIIGIASLLGGFLTQMKAMGAGTAR